MLFETLIQTVARIEECLNIKRKHYDFERNTLDLYVTKSKATKGQSKEVGGARRGFSISSSYAKKIKHYINTYRICPDDYMFVKRLPENFDSKSREEKKKYLKAKQVAVSQLMKRALQRAGLVSWEFSLHNIRKTHGMWLKALIPYSREITEGEICMRLGHDMNTFLKHYGSPSIFNERDKNMMIAILGDIYGLK
jgi:integrase